MENKAKKVSEDMLGLLSDYISKLKNTPADNVEDIEKNVRALNGIGACAERCQRLEKGLTIGDCL